MAAQTSLPTFWLSLTPNARLERTDESCRIFVHGQTVHLRKPVPLVADALNRLAEGEVIESSLHDQAVQSGGASALISLLSVLHALDASGALTRRLTSNGRSLARLVPTASGFRFDPDLPPTHRRKGLSRFAFLHADHGGAIVESAHGRAKLELHDFSAVAAVAALAEWRQTPNLEAFFPELRGAAIGGLLTLLHNAGALADADFLERPEAPGGEGSPATWWEFHDLLFHMRSRRGRHSAPYGGTYPHKTLSPPPLAKPVMAGETVLLPRPDLEQLRRYDAPFTDVLERRRSIRLFKPEPLTLEQLGEFLFRAARYQAVLHGGATDYALCASPAGGALHELELYAVVARCHGLGPGVYHYRRGDHQLTRIANPSPRYDHLLAEATRTAGCDSHLSVYFQVTARCQRVFWKYESIPYALILKNVGALLTTMYLVATAMALAPCALGGGDSELFSLITGIDPLEEPAVGEFVLGTRGES